MKSNAWMGSPANQKLLEIFSTTTNDTGLLTWSGVQRAIAANPEICGETGCNMRTARTVFDQMKSKNRDTVAVHDFTQALINAMCMGGKNIDNVILDFEQFRINRELTIMGETSTCQIADEHLALKCLLDVVRSVQNALSDTKRVAHGLVQRHKALLGNRQHKNERPEGMEVTSPTQSPVQSLPRSQRMNALHSRSQRTNSWSRFLEGEASIGRRAVERELMAAMNFGIFQPQTYGRVQTVAAGRGGASAFTVDSQSVAPKSDDADVARRATGQLLAQIAIPANRLLSQI